MDRTREKLLEELRRLAGSYVPEWKFDPGNPDIGSAIGMIFAEQLEQNIQRYRRIPEQQWENLLAMAKIRPACASPAEAVVVLQADEQADRPVRIRKGSRFLGSGKKEVPVIFQAVHTLDAVGARLMEILHVSEAEGKMISCRFLDAMGQQAPFWMFESAGENLFEEEVFFYQDIFLNGSKGTVEMVFSGIERSGIEKSDIEKYDIEKYGRETAAGDQDERDPAAEEAAEVFADPSCFAFFFETDSGRQPAAGVRYEGDKLLILKPAGLSGRVKALVLKRLRHTRERISVRDIRFVTAGKALSPQFLHDGNTERKDGEAVLLFGKELEIYKECWIGQDEVFSHPGAQVTMEFILSFGRFERGTREDGEEELKLVKRRPRHTLRLKKTEVKVQEADLSYFNGKGFRSLQCPLDALYEPMAEGMKKKCTVTFQCPEDWEPVAAGGFEARSLRLQVLRADGCYAPESVHRYPVLEKIRFSYGYPEKGSRPEKIRLRSEGREKEVPEEAAGTGRLTLFPGFPYRGNSMLFGFSRKLSGEKVSLYMVFENHIHFPGMQVRYEYSASDGFRPLKAEDHTRGLAVSGTIIFSPPEDMEQMNIGGKNLWWIRMTECPCRYGASGSGRRERQYHPHLRGVYLNGLEVRNTEILEWQEYDMDRPAPGMTFPVRGEHILSAGVWVNEKEYLSDEEIKKRLAEDPDQCYAEYDFAGKLTAFFCLWKEVEDFEGSDAASAHYILDRKKGLLTFGDGHRGRILSCTTGTAFRVQAVRCDGILGNVAAGRINDMAARPLFLEAVSNPLPAWGGEDTESAAHMKKRGGNVIRTGNRIITREDYVRAAGVFSPLIREAAYIPGSGGEAFVVVRMKDTGTADSFAKISGRLEAWLNSLNPAGSRITVREPVYGKVSVKVWLDAPEGEFDELKELFLKKLSDYFALEEGANRRGFGIGEIPRKSQIRMMLGSIPSHARVKKMEASLSYADEEGLHTADLEEVKPNPFFFCLGGRHQICPEGGERDAGYPAGERKNI